VPFNQRVQFTPVFFSNRTAGDKNHVKTTKMLLMLSEFLANDAFDPVPLNRGSGRFA